MNKVPYISVIMPCYNAAAYISRSVASVLTQTFERIELIVVNDGSTDESLHVLEEIDDPRVKVITQSNQGVSAARNRALKEAKGDYIAFLDADDTWRPECLDKLYAALNSDPTAALAYCGWQNIGLTGPRTKPYIPPAFETPSKMEALLHTCPWPIHAALTRKKFIDEAGGFDERFSNSEDYRLWLRIASSHRVVRVPEVLAYYHFHEGTQASKNAARAAKQNFAVKVEFLREHPEIAKDIGRKRVRELTLGMLLKRGYECYWQRDLASARFIFRMVMKSGYGSLKDWVYMIPSLMPLALHKSLIQWLSRDGDDNQ